MRIHQAGHDICPKIYTAEFLDQNFTPSISLNFNSFSDISTKKWVKMETVWTNLTSAPGLVVLLDMASNGLANRSIQRPTYQRIFEKRPVGGGSLKLSLNRKSFGSSLITTSSQKMTISVESAQGCWSHREAWGRGLGTNSYSPTNSSSLDLFKSPMAPMEHKYISFILHIYISSFFVFWWRTRHNHT